MYYFSLELSVNMPSITTGHCAVAIDNVVTNMTETIVSINITAISDHYGQQITIGGHEPKRDPLNNKQKNRHKALKSSAPQSNSFNKYVEPYKLR